MDIAKYITRRIFTEGMGRALRHRHFRNYQAIAWISAVGLWVQQLAIAWLTWELTKSGFWLGAVVMASAVPTILFVTIAGAVVDRYDRLVMIKVVQFSVVVLAALLTVLSLAGLINIYVLITIVTAQGVVAAFNMPVRMAMAPNLVPKEDLTAAISIHSVLFNSTRFVGPALGGLILSKLDVSWAFIFYTVSSLIFLTGLFAIQLIHHEHSEGKHSGLIGDVIEGVKYTVHHSAIGPLLLFVIIAVIVTRPFMELLPGYVDTIFGRGPEALGTLISVFGLGGIFGALCLAIYARSLGLMTILLCGFALTGVLLMAFATTSSYVFAIVCVIALGFLHSVTGNASLVLVQNAVAGSMRGRVMSLYGLTYRAAPATGALVMGAASTVIGFRVPVIAGAVICLVALALVLPKRRRMATELEARPGS